MGMQTDVKIATLTNSGYMLKFRTRVKGISVKGTSTAGSIQMFDTVTDPVSATYARTAATITVTKVAHGLQVGQNIGLSFAIASGSSGTSGNYVIATAAADTFTITDINSGTIAGGTACLYAPRWITTFRFADGDVYTNVFPIPGEGVLAENGVHATLTNITALSIFYG